MVTMKGDNFDSKAQIRELFHYRWSMLPLQAKSNQSVVLNYLLLVTLKDDIAGSKAQFKEPNQSYS